MLLSILKALDTNCSQNSEPGKYLYHLTSWELLFLGLGELHDPLSISLCLGFQETQSKVLYLIILPFPSPGFNDIHSPFPTPRTRLPRPPPSVHVTFTFQYLSMIQFYYTMILVDICSVQLPKGYFPLFVVIEPQYFLVTFFSPFLVHTVQRKLILISWSQGLKYNPGQDNQCALLLWLQ